MLNKAKASGQESNPNSLALALGGLAEWSNASGLHPVDGGLIAVQGFESLTRRHFSLPSDGANHHQGEKRTAEAARIRKFSIRLLAVDRKEVHIDMSFMQDRSGEGRKGPECRSAVQVPAVRQALL